MDVASLHGTSCRQGVLNRTRDSVTCPGEVGTTDRKREGGATESEDKEVQEMKF